MSNVKDAKNYLDRGILNGSQPKPNSVVTLPPPPPKFVSRKFEAPQELWDLTELYVQYVLEENNYPNTAQMREAHFPSIIIDRLRAGINQDKSFKSYLEKKINGLQTSSQQA